MLRKFAALALAFVAALALPLSAGATDFTVGSLNTLHLGWGTSATTKNKCDQIEKLMATVDILLLQEVMQLNVPCTLSSGLKTDCSVVMKGGGTYREAYCLVYQSSKFKLMCYADDNTGSFSRPPYAVMMQFQANKKYAWFANIHSIFGKTVGPRKAEATAGGVFFKSLMTRKCTGMSVPPKGFPVVFAGDWNLPVTNKAGVYNVGFAWADPDNNPTTDPAACPKKSPTSLTAAGVPSSPYDHFVITEISLTGDDTCSLTSNALSKQKWRQDVSDHLAITWGISFK